MRDDSEIFYERINNTSISLNGTTERSLYKKICKNLFSWGTILNELINLGRIIMCLLLPVTFHKTRFFRTPFYISPLMIVFGNSELRKLLIIDSLNCAKCRYLTLNATEMYI